MINCDATSIIWRSIRYPCCYYCWHRSQHIPKLPLDVNGTPIRSQTDDKAQPSPWLSSLLVLWPSQIFQRKMCMFFWAHSFWEAIWKINSVSFLFCFSQSGIVIRIQYCDCLATYFPVHKGPNKCSLPVDALVEKWWLFLVKWILTWVWTLDASAGDRLMPNTTINAHPQTWSTIALHKIPL